jgi:hypothetical protein
MPGHQGAEGRFGLPVSIGAYAAIMTDARQYSCGCSKLLSCLRTFFVGNHDIFPFLDYVFGHDPLLSLSLTVSVVFFLPLNIQTKTGSKGYKRSLPIVDQSVKLQKRCGGKAFT